MAPPGSCGQPRNRCSAPRLLVCGRGRATPGISQRGVNQCRRRDPHSRSSLVDWRTAAFAIRCRRPGASRRGSTARSFWRWGESAELRPRHRRRRTAHRTGNLRTGGAGPRDDGGRSHAYRYRRLCLWTHAELRPGALGWHDRWCFDRGRSPGAITRGRSGIRTRISDRHIRRSRAPTQCSHPGTDHDPQLAHRGIAVAHCAESGRLSTKSVAVARMGRHANRPCESGCPALVGDAYAPVVFLAIMATGRPHPVVQPTTVG